MNSKEQRTFINDVKKKVKDKGYRIGFFLKYVSISPTHWHFLKNAERPLTLEKKEKIEEFINLF